MGYRNLSECVADLERHGHLVRVEHPVDPRLEVAEIQRRLYRKRGPAVLFTRPLGTRFPLLINLYGTPERTRFLFRDALETVRTMVALKADPAAVARRPWKLLGLPAALWKLRPKFPRSGPILRHTCSLAELPQVVCWPGDGGPFVTLPAVYTEHPDRPGWMRSNIGMYRVQIGGNDYAPDECGLHYQIHRGCGGHHAAALRRGEPLRVNVIVGGPPALPFSAVMPLPEGMPELAFAAALGGRRLTLVPAANGLPMPAEADFVISGVIEPGALKPEGPFGDHLGYYSLAHPFPLMKVLAVHHRPGAIWPLTVVGRPPQEDTSFGELIHDLTGPAIGSVLPGIHAVHAVDAAGVHPLLLAIGSERYVPYAAERRPQELLTMANAVLGQGQLSLAKYLLIAAKEDDPELDIHDVRAFFGHVLSRFDPETDLHFQTRTTIDTLDYSAGEGLNAGSKLVIAACGRPRRTLAGAVPDGLRLPPGFGPARVVMPGVLAIGGPSLAGVARDEIHPDLARLCGALNDSRRDLEGFPLVTLVDDADFCAADVSNWLWAVFTRSNPAADVWGAGGRVWRKHFGCPGPVVIDARLKPHMAPPLVEDPATTRRVDALAARGGPLHGLID